MDTVEGRRVGRMRIELPGRYEDNVVPVGFLREQGLHVESVTEDLPESVPGQRERLAKEDAK
jgi:D-methionine transport system ATP-binding protein